MWAHTSNSEAITVRERLCVSMQIASRKLGREEETWVTQVLTRLRLVETHLEQNGDQSFVVEGYVLPASRCSIDPLSFFLALCCVLHFSWHLVVVACARRCNAPRDGVRRSAF